MAPVSLTRLRWARLASLLAVAAIAAGCHLPAGGRDGLPRLREEGELWIYLEPLPPGAERLDVALASAAVVSGEGKAIPLELRLPRISEEAGASQRLLAHGRLPAGRYQGFQVAIGGATLATDEGASRLLVPSEPTLVPAAITVQPGRAAVLSVVLQYGEAVQKGYAFAPAFTAFTPARPVPQLVALCSNAGGASVTAFDRQRSKVGEVLATGAGPRGLVLDTDGARLYVAASLEDAVDVVDLGSGAALPSIALRPGDRPAEMALARDGRTLLVVDEGANALSFLDLGSRSELARVPVGDAPRGLLLDRAGQRAYVLDRGSSAITVVDVAQRAVVGTAATEPEPLQAALSRDGSRLFVVSAGSVYLTVLSVPDLAVVSRVFVGLGARSVLVDTRTDLVYVGGALGGSIAVLDPFSLVRVDALDVAGDVGWLAIADQENTLLALLPERRQIAVIDLASRERRATLDVGDRPYQLVLAGQRR
ncbi:YVTN family beta-propeller repeat protein [Anaeromyxobacter oryzisoli]|uniref:YVTN family beta-propeller repeat protein n=1 Tax=Anaeromyxobacter oryzisoli TaxID=2925408 RepID=UPI001F5A74D5|nr:beta-propeller fold lactonase family protein [Anaeromyxobacter sp. SG63]